MKLRTNPPPLLKMAAAEPNEHKCPACKCDYTDPKLLPCAHLACRKCVISRLSKEDQQGKCPVCCVPILPASDAGQGDLGSAVDSWPTDLMTVAVVESKRILSSPNSCVCDNSKKARFLCLQCGFKLCSPCAKSHLEAPSIQHHDLEDPCDVSIDRLSGFRQPPCSSHEKKPAELYCRSHRELICMLCSHLRHRRCSDLGGIKEEARVQREELRKQVERFKEKEKALEIKIKELNKQIEDGQVKFQMMRDEIKATFDDLKKTMEDQYKELIQDVDQREEAYTASRKEPRDKLDSHRAGLGAHAKFMGKVASAQDDFLLGILVKLKRRLDDLESRQVCEEASKDAATEVGSISFDACLVTDLKRLIRKLGVVKGQEFVCSLCGLHEKSTLEGPEYADIMKVGDRVRRGRDWHHTYLFQDGYPPGLGTITSIDMTELETAQAIRVMWDTGLTYSYRMGYEKKYDLQFARCTT